MKILRHKADLDAELTALRAQNKSIGWVGTSGALHEGHLSLLRHAGSENDAVIMFWTGDMAFPWAGISNPSYPRDYEKDAAMAASAGAKLLYIPRGEEIYPQPPIVTVTTPALHRPGLTAPQHLDMVALFMSKFLSMVGGCTCYMGEKDWQQLVMMRQVASDLSLPVTRFVITPTVRDADGVPLSSRNIKLTPENRIAAAIVPQALEAAARAIAEGERDPNRVREIIVERIEGQALLVYAHVVSETLQDINPLRGPIRLMACARFGEVEILDNLGVNI
ncbi:MAG TPA: pantothenate synthetase [Pseudomonas xinjiangensis]|uniref:pantoate--beta-alanine ligase (AMP-forming) n=2 Tax=root TaxID=1 RepID=A0A7V1FSV8_9GAMM|nr:pantothenate synthetase [Halopseudomonas xinjiangensis]HEC47872.1 pantothenate synthetase [Halopseudomonas xinjiangensis]